MNDPRSIHKIIRIIAQFQNLYPSMPVQMAAAFLMVAYLDEPTSIDIASHAQLTRSAASRYTQDLGEITRTGAEGLKLVEKRTDPMDRRTVRFRLTPKGRELVTLLTRIVEA